MKFLNNHFLIFIILIKFVYNFKNQIHSLNKLSNNTIMKNKPIYMSPNGKLRTLEYQGQTRLPTFIN